jgi:uncharacterized membrane protein
MKKYLENLAKALLGMEYGKLSHHEQQVINSIAREETIAENPNLIYEEELGLGQHLADRVSRFVGSWTFIIIFVVIMTAWVILNSFLLIGALKPFDPYPYILLNLGLSTLAAIQAPVIMMSQNRQSEKDKIKVEANYQIGLKSELEIMRLHQKIDALMSAMNIEQENQSPGE